MTLIRNNKTSPVSLPLKDSKALLLFKPGVHDYPDEKLDALDTSRASVRAYLEPAKNGEPAVIEVVREDSGRVDPPPPEEPKTAAELVDEIKGSVDLERLMRLAKEDQRSTVVNAAANRLEELTGDEG